MTSVHVLTLGRLQVVRDGEELNQLPAQRLRCALLVYLSLERQATRDEIVTLLWPDRGPERARHALAQTVYELRSALGDEWVESRGDVLAVSDTVTVDAVDFDEAVERKRWTDAAELYRGPFLQGIYLVDNRQFEGWCDRLRARLSRRHGMALREAVDEQVEKGNLTTALRLARTGVELDPLNDDAQHRLIQLLAESGQRSEALQQYERYRDSLEAELEVEPLEETEELVRRIRDGEAGSSITIPSGWAGPLTEHRVRLAPLNRVPKASFRRVWLLALLFAAVLVVASVLATEDSSWEDRPSSIAVLPFHFDGASPEERTLAVQFSEQITQELHRWDQVQALGSVDVTGPRMDLGLAEPTLARLDDGIAIAKELDAGAMLALTVYERADSAFLQASVFDARTGRRVGEPIVSGGSLDGFMDVDFVAPVVASVLGLADAPAPQRALHAGTRDPDAALAYLLGLEDLERNRLESADQRFRRALELDPTFASALARLAQTSFWRIGQDPSLTEQLGPEIAQLSTVAVDHLDGLSRQNSLHVRAFYAFQLGDYEQARELYEGVLQSYPADLHALLMSAEIEVQDPWLARGDDGELKPRSDLNRARRSILETVRIRPRFELGYGRLFEVQQIVEAPLSREACPVFEQPRDQMISPWQARAPTGVGLTFCPVVQDSLTWISRAEFAATDKEVFRRGAEQLFRQAVAAFERWASFSPDQPRALEELSDALALERSRIEVAAPERLQELGERALEHASRAALLRADTTPERLVRLANLNLAAGRRSVAIDLAKRAVERYSDAGPEALRQAPGALMNPLVVSGQTSLALTLASGRPARRYIQRPGTDAVISFAGAEPVAERIRVLYSIGVGGPILRETFEELEHTWRVAGHTTEERQHLRNHVAFEGLGLATALADDSAGMAAWGGLVGVQHPLWQALQLSFSDSARSRELYARALAEEPDALPPSARAFLLGSVAGGLGLDLEAIRHYSLLDSIPYNPQVFDPGWGLQVRSELRRAKHHQRLGNLIEAEEHLERFMNARVWPDSLSAPALQQVARNFSN